MGDVEGLPDVDWSPLADRTVHLLVTNHSGVGLPEKYVELAKVAEFLDELNIGIDLQFIEVAVEYKLDPDRKFADIAEYLAAASAKSNKPEVKSVVELSRDQFGQRVEEAQRFIEFRENGFQPANSAPVEEPVKDADDEEEGPCMDFLLYPYIAKGEVNMIYAPEGIGKSSLDASMTGAITSGQDLIAGRCCPTPKSVSGPVHSLFIDLEGPACKDPKKGCFWDVKRRCCDPYLNEEQMARLMIRSDIPRAEGQATALAIREVAAEHKKASPDNADLVIFIDHYLGLVGDPEPTNAWKNIVKPLFDELRAMGYTIILIDHANSSGKQAGFKAKMRDAASIITLEPVNEDGTPGTLEKPRLLKFIKSRKVGLQSAIAPVAIVQDQKTGRWTVYDQETGEIPTADELRLLELREMKMISDHFKQRGASVDAIAAFLGYKRSRYYELLKELKKLESELDS